MATGKETLKATVAYCAKCNAPHAPMIAVLMRCGPCAVLNGKLPPNKFKEKK